MKIEKLVILTAVGLVSFQLAAQAAQNANARKPASSSKNYSCAGVYDENQGNQLKLTIFEESYVAAGTSSSGNGFPGKIDCKGRYTGESRDKKYEQFSADESCGVDYVKVMKTLSTTGSGMLVLARKSGGDGHDFSGYAYRYYHCVSVE